MLHQVNIKGFLRWARVTVFASLLILGVAATAGADSFHSGKTKAKETCDNGTEVTQGKINPKISSLTIVPLPFPSFDLTVNIVGFAQFTGSGVVIAKNDKVSEFHAELSNADNQHIFLTGKALVDPNSPDPDVVKTNGKMFGLDHNTDCIFVGKFKTKADPSLIP